MLRSHLTRAPCLQKFASCTSRNRYGSNTSLYLFISQQFLLKRRCHCSTLSTVDRGTHFENVSLRLLQQHLSMSLTRVGGKEDGGIDLLGWWWIPDLDAPTATPTSWSSSPSPRPPRRRVRVVAQCKAEKKKPGPRYVRELEGVVYRYMARDAASKLSSSSSLMAVAGNPAIPAHDVSTGEAEDEEETSPLVQFESTPGPIVAIFISESPFTKSTLLRAMSSSVPFLLIHIPPKLPKDKDADALDGTSTDDNPSPGSAVWNPALGGGHGLLKGRMEVRWSWKVNANPTLLLSSPTAVPGVSGTPSLWFEGQKLPSWTPDSGKAFL